MGFLIYCANTEENKREPIHKFLELPDDPTEEELAKMTAEAMAKKADEDMKAYYQALEFYNQKGVQF